MKLIHKTISVLLCVILFVFPFYAFAEESDDPNYEPGTDIYEDIPFENTPSADTTAPHGSLSRETTSNVTTTKSVKAIDPPLVKITRENLNVKPKAGQTFMLTVVFHNYSGEVSLRSGLASFEVSDGLVLVENSASKVVPVIGPSGVRSVQIKLLVAKDVESANQSVAVTYSYSYQTPEGLQQAQAEEKLLLTVEPAESSSEKNDSAAATPNIIVTGYSYGGTVTAGDEFTLALQFHNTSKKLAAENIVMSVEVSEGLSITSASNTYYFASLGAQKSQSQSIPMRVAVNADSDGAKIDISFRYEYVDKGTRSEASASERLSIPIYIPDRFTVSAPDMELIGTQNEELSVSLPYINKSRIEVSNVSAELLYDEATVYCEQPRINLGNFESGKSGTIDFYFMPLEAGSGVVTVQITYEDELMQEKQMQIRVPYSADAGYFDPGTDEPFDDPGEETSANAWLRIAVPCAIVLAVVCLIVFLTVRKKKKKKAADSSIQFDWDMPQEVKTHEDQ